MLNILIAGEGKKDKFSTAILSTLRIAKFGYFYTSISSIDINPVLGHDKSYLILECNSKYNISGFNADVLILKENRLINAANIAEAVKENGYLFFDPQYGNIPEAIIDMNLRPISCGLNEKNTITLASLDSDKITVSIQREINSFWGKAIVPQDFTVNINQDKEILPLIMAAGIIALSV